MNILEACAEIIKDNEKVYVSEKYKREHKLYFQCNSIEHVIKGCEDGGTELTINNEMMKIYFKLLQEPMDFIKASSSKKKVYPVEYFSPFDRALLDEFWENREVEGGEVVSWLSDYIDGKNTFKYIEGMWIEG